MELRHFRYFIAVAEDLNFSRAARRLHVSQPPLTQAIQQLEEEFEVKLFHRTSRKVELTEAGNLLLIRARSILTQIARTGAELRLQSQVKKEVLRVGFTRITPVIPKAMKTFRRRFSEVHLELLSSVGRSTQDFLMDDEGDLNIGEYLPPDPHLDSRLWAELKLFAIVATSHPLAKKGPISIRDLRDQPILLPGLSNPIHMGRQALAFCRDHGHSDPQLIRHCDDMEVLVSLVASEAGVGISHALDLKKDRIDFKTVPFRENTPKLKVGLVWRRDRATPALSGLIQELELMLRPLVKDIPGIVRFEKSLAKK